MLRSAPMLAPARSGFGVSRPSRREGAWRGLALAALGAALVAGCSGAVPSGPKAPSRLPPPKRPPAHLPAPQPRPAPTIQVAPGLQGVIGADGDALVRQFGPPRLDIKEEDARKLQWSGAACILDVYLYPPQSGGRPTATYVDARRGDGREVDRAACIAALKRP
ncbi:hypothetical protein [Novosphingobium sp. SG720]|uniref:hypothetical protein n=1 Tax=Novosphingobium sp. SG720 TaxID=2586998 RepID=UPI0017F9DDBD|nr:hypothetical protein [Novosphingobium sp. SG720]